MATGHTCGSAEAWATGRGGFYDGFAPELLRFLLLSASFRAMIVLLLSFPVRQAKQSPQLSAKTTKEPGTSFARTTFPCVRR